MDQLNFFMFWLIGQLHGLNGLALFAFILFVSGILLAARPGPSRRDSKRRNQAHRIK